MLISIAEKMLRKRLGCQMHDFPACRLPAQLDLTVPSRILVFAPHPDDETLGCGGTLALLAAQPGCHIKAVLVTDGGGGGELPTGTDRVRQREFRKALAQLGISDIDILGAPDGAFVATTEIVRRTRNLVADFNPDWVFLPSPIDYHRDHLRIGFMLTTLCQAVAPSCQLLFYEVWSPVPATHVVDISSVIERKQGALACHATAMACGDYLRAVEGLNRYRGLYLGRDRWAEAFWILPAHTSSALLPRALSAALNLWQFFQKY